MCLCVYVCVRESERGRERKRRKKRKRMRGEEEAEMGIKTQVSVLKDAASPASLSPAAPPVFLSLTSECRKTHLGLDGVYKEKTGEAEWAGEGSRWDWETPGVLRHGGRKSWGRQKWRKCSIWYCVCPFCTHFMSHVWINYHNNSQGFVLLYLHFEMRKLRLKVIKTFLPLQKWVWTQVCLTLDPCWEESSTRFYQGTAAVGFVNGIHEQAALPFFSMGLG